MTEEVVSPMPKGARALLFIQIFSTLSFSVLYFSLVLYMTKFLHLSDVTATSIMASFVAFNYALHLFGGYIGGRFLSYRSLFCISMVLQGAGCLIISGFTMTHLYWGLAAFLTGSGLNVTCVNCMLTQLFKPEDTRAEGAFMWNYSGMNIGFALGITLGGYLDHNYQSLFMISSFTNLIAILLTFISWSKLKDRHTYLASASKEEKRKKKFLGSAIIVLMIPLLLWFLHHSQLSSHLVMVVGGIMIFVIAGIALNQATKEARNKVWAYLILGISSLVFWTLYQLLPMGLTLFIDRNVDRHIGNFLIPTQWYQNINTFIIIVGGPSLAYLFQKMRDRGWMISVPIQFCAALVLIGLSLVILPVGIQLSNAQGLTGASWIVGSFVFQSIGELFISPIGYSMIGYLAPPRLQGLMMGTWMMITGVAATMSGYFSNMAGGEAHATDPLITNSSYSHMFNLLGWSSVIAGVVLVLLIPSLHKLMKQVKASSLNNISITKENKAISSLES